MPVARCRGGDDPIRLARRLDRRKCRTRVARSDRRDHAGIRGVVEGRLEHVGVRLAARVGAAEAEVQHVHAVSHRVLHRLRDVL